MLHHVVLRMLIPLEGKDESYYELVAESDWDLEMMRAPTLFAFVCKKPLHIPMEAKVSKITDDHVGKKRTSLFFSHKNNSNYFLGPLAMPMIVNYNATLVLNDVKLELFRFKRYYNDFTHLKYDCELGWPYEWVAHTILVIALVLAVSLFVNFTSRFLKEKQNI